jgi:GR25 family glycosyltransferase involved in LPS biosynthesis
MKGFVINLDRRQDRYSTFMETFKNTDIEITRVPAVDSQNMEFKSFDGIILKNRICEWNFQHLTISKIKNVVACCLSHQQVWKKISKMTNEKYVFVFEDDCAFINKKDFNIVVPNDYCIVWLNRNVKNQVPSTLLGIIPHNSSDYTTEAYAITPKFAKGMLKWMTNYLGAVDAHMDQYIKMVENIGIAVSYEINPPIFCQSDSPSDIQ